MRPRRSVNVVGLVASPEEKTSRPNLRLHVLGLVMLLLFGVMILRLWSLQVINQKTFAAQVSQNQVRLVTLPAPRGEIVDRNDSVLVQNTVSQEIVLSRVAAAVHPSVIGDVAALTGQSPSAVANALTDPRYSPFEPVPVLTDAPAATVQYLQEHAAEYPGVSVEFVTQRTYPQGGTMAAHILGYVGSINGGELAAHPNQGYTTMSQIGKSGIEAQYEPYLRGLDGQQALSVNAQGQVVGTLRTTNPEPGDTVILNIDTGLQAATQAALQDDMNADRNIVDPTTKLYPTADLGAAVVMDARTGQVLAMASNPTYDLNQWVGGISNKDYAAIQASGAENNNAIQGLFTPGSTFKLATATAALQTGLMGANQYVDDTGALKVPCVQGVNSAECTFNDAEAQGAGEVDLPTALTISDDYYFYNLGYLFWLRRFTYGPTPIQNVAEQYGLGTLTGIDLPGEVAGRADSQTTRQQLHAAAPGAFPNTGWTEGDNIEMAFGQGETVVTPIEEAVAYATFANQGTRYVPQVAAGIVNQEGQLIKRFTPQVAGHVNLPNSIYQPILQGLQGVVTGGGTASATFQADAHFSPSQFPIAGKTGTADIGLGKEPNAWFVGFGPLNAPPGQPEYVVAVVVQHGGYGAQAAAPAVMQIFNYLATNPIHPVVFPTKSVPSHTSVPQNNPPAGVTTTTTSTSPSSPNGG